MSDTLTTQPAPVRAVVHGEEAAGQVGFELVVDRTSLTHLAGVTIDFVDNPEGQGFVIDNPHPPGSCDCGAPHH